MWKKEIVQTAGITNSPVITLESILIEAERLYSVFSEHNMIWRCSNHLTTHLTTLGDNEYEK